VADKLAVVPQYLLPKKALTLLAGKIAASQSGGLTSALIRWFIKRYGVNMAEAANPLVESYSSFVCPVDGAISQFGKIDKDQIFQAKGHSYSTRALLGGDSELAARFDDGAFATLYLSPKDYHRIHMPCDGRLVRMIHVPGDLFSVNPTTARGVPGLFARNERVVCVFESAYGTFTMVLVGATIVGSMATVWHGLVNPPRPDNVRDWHYKDKNIVLKRGDEMGRFLLGSTVVMTFERNRIQFNPDWSPTKGIKMGEVMGNFPKVNV
jgi:phosphatidylserine decarboxylase